MVSLFWVLSLAVAAHASPLAVTAIIKPSGSAAGCTTAWPTNFAIGVISVGSDYASTTTMLESSHIASKSGEAVSQITDGQIQASTYTAPAVSQIHDGQIQATTSTAYITTAAAISQIHDGQIQATYTESTTKSTGAAVSQITDGQIQATYTESTTESTGAAVSQITDGQIQATKKTTLTTASAVSQINDGQTQSKDESSDIETPSVDACKNSGTLDLTLNGTVLKDSHGRTGYIASNYQFQFDDPPQSGALITAGFSICGNDTLALGPSTIFYQCLSGTFYNLYSRSIGGQCHPINLRVMNLVSC